jgi:hypothetical protein
MKHLFLRQGATSAGLLLCAVLASACAGTTALPAPRPLVVSSGARLAVEQERMQEIYDWVLPQVETIEADPTFVIHAIESEEDRYPWETLVIACCKRSPMQLGDTARYRYDRANPDVDTSYNIYAHLHLMDRMNRLREWAPEAADVQGYDRERAIVKRMADSWLLGRAIFDAAPHALMDELIYTSEQGHLDAFIFTARPDAFPEAKRTWEAQNPQGLQTFQTWFRDTFKHDPPGTPTRPGGER